MPPCFAANATVQLASGAVRAMADLRVGDSILSADASGRISYSAVVYLPHGPNDQAATFLRVTTESGKAVTATPTHLLVACDGSLVPARDASCLRTETGGEAVSSVETLRSEGIYSAVTLDNEFLVVDGVVASPFAVAHAPAHAFYHLHRFLYRRFPGTFSPGAAADPPKSSISLLLLEAGTALAGAVASQLLWWLEPWWAFDDERFGGAASFGSLASSVGEINFFGGQLRVVGGVRPCCSRCSI